jgi:hypothetical protein
MGLLAENCALRSELESLKDQTTSAGALRARVSMRLGRIQEGDYSVIEMAADLEKLLAVQWSGKCYREGCQAGSNG